MVRKNTFLSSIFYKLYDLVVGMDLQSQAHNSLANNAWPSKSFYIKEGYAAREKGEYFADTLTEQGVIHQPDVYEFVRYLGNRYYCSHIIDIGCGRALKLAKLHPEFKVIGVDYGSNIQYCRSQYNFGQWIESDLEHDLHLPIDGETLNNCIVVCSDVIEHLVDPTKLLTSLKRLLDRARAGVITTPERDLVRGKDDFGPPKNPSHVREWNLEEFQSLVSSFRFKIGFMGLTFNNNCDLEKKTIAAVLENNYAPSITSAPSRFRVIALMTSYNEADIIYYTIKRLVDQGIEVYLIDNWSTDATVSTAKKLLGNGLLGIERFPPEGPARFYEWTQLLRRVEQLSNTLDADWFIHHDADEVRQTLWIGTNLKEGLYHVDQCKCNAVDHTCIVFPPVDDYFQGGDPETYFNYYEFGNRPGHFLQIKAWKNLGIAVSLAASGGHEVQFQGRRVYPYKFLLKHYPIRSQTHGRKKVLSERKPRLSPEERARGWHIQYDDVGQDYNFLRSVDELQRFDEKTFYGTMLFERLSGVGIRRRVVPTPSRDSLC